MDPKFNRYARNYLLPKGLAVEATEKNAKALDHLKRQMAYKKDKVVESARNLAARLGELTVELVHQAGEEGKLFGAVTNMEIAAFLKDKGFDIDRKTIVLAEPIKHLGEFNVAVKIHPEVPATVKVVVKTA